MSDYTPQRIKRSTCDRIREIGKMGESFDDVVNRIIDERETKEK